MGLMYVFGMSTTPQEVIDAIDAAILGWVGEPVSVTFKGRTVTYRSLNELLQARTHFSQLLAATAKTEPFQLRRVKAGGA